MRDAVGLIHSAIDRIHHPSIITELIAGNAFLPQEVDPREGRVKCPLDLLLTTDVELKLNVVLGDRLNTLGRSKVPSHQLPGRQGGVNGFSMCCS